MLNLISRVESNVICFLVKILLCYNLVDEVSTDPVSFETIILIVYYDNQIRTSKSFKFQVSRPCNK